MYIWGNQANKLRYAGRFPEICLKRVLQGLDSGTVHEKKKKNESRITDIKFSKISKYGTSFINLLLRLEKVFEESKVVKG